MADSVRARLFSGYVCMGGQGLVRPLLRYVCATADSVKIVCVSPAVHAWNDAFSGGLGREIHFLCLLDS